MSDFKATRRQQEGSHDKLMASALRKQARLIDLAPVAAIVRELDGTITYWSGGAEALYGWTKEEALGHRSHELLQTVFPQSLDTIVAALTKGRKWSGELQHHTKDGRSIIVQSYWLGEFNARGEVTELLETKH
jgi:PAS domain S-box-containing protein